MRTLSRIFVVISFSLLIISCANPSRKENAVRPRPLVLTTDFGLKDGAVSAMRGVAYQVSEDLLVSDLTHEIPPFDIWAASYRLKQTVPYWPLSVFVTVVDPGVGSERQSIVAKTRSGHFFVGPDNGYLTLVDEVDPIVETRVIDESRRRLKGSDESYTFHGRDLYVYVGAQLASAVLRFEDVGPLLDRQIVKIKYQPPTFENGVLRGAIPVLDPNYGNVWTNLPKKLVQQHFPRAKALKVRIQNGPRVVFKGRLPVVETFAAVPKGQPLLYFNSLLNLSMAVNQGDFASQHKVSSGADWIVVVEPSDR